MPVNARRGGKFRPASNPFKAPTLMVLTRSTEGFSAPLASLYTVFFGGISIIRLSSYRHKALRYLLGRGILQIVVSAMPERTYWNKHYYCADPICALERITGAAPVPEVWKTPILLLYDTRILLLSFVSYIYIIAKISPKIKF